MYKYRSKKHFIKKLQYKQKYGKKIELLILKESRKVKHYNISLLIL